MNRFKGLDLLDRVPEELWMEVHNTVQEVVTKTIHPQGKEMQEDKVEESWKIAEKRGKRQGRKGMIYPSECRVPENSKER